jgi:PPOX class probable F420-dependent enzyme
MVSPTWYRLVLMARRELYILTQPGSQKVRNLKNNPKVTLALQAAPDGDDIVILEGTSAFLEPGDFAPLRPAYEKKYKEAMAALEMDMDQMTASYSLLIKVTPKRINVW